jgi:hypothetical protein
LVAVVALSSLESTLTLSALPTGNERREAVSNDHTRYYGLTGTTPSPIEMKRWHGHPREADYSKRKLGG